MRLVALSGSLREKSRNSALLRYISKISPDGVDIEVLSIADLPLFNADLLGAEGTLPAVAERLRDQVAAADGVLIATPEYNYGIPGPLKNAIDWLSRPAYHSVFAGKPVATLTLSPSHVGGARAHAHLKLVLLGMAAAVMPSPELSLGGKFADLDSSGEPLLAGQRVDEWLRNSLAWVARFAEEPAPPLTHQNSVVA